MLEQARVSALVMIFGGMITVLHCNFSMVEQEVRFALWLGFYCGTIH
jgi:hypothetical protein